MMGYKLHERFCVVVQVEPSNGTNFRNVNNNGNSNNNNANNSNGVAFGFGFPKISSFDDKYILPVQREQKNSTRYINVCWDEWYRVNGEVILRSEGAYDPSAIRINCSSFPIDSFASVLGLDEEGRELVI